MELNVSNERFEDLEMRLAYQDQMLNELNDVVTDQQARIMQLEKHIKALSERMQAMADSAPAAGQGDEKPPHY